MARDQRRTGLRALALGAIVLAAGCARPAPAPAPARVVAVVTGSTCGGPVSPPAGVIAAVFARTNSDRAANGLGALRWDAQLSCLASSGNAQRASTATFVHQDLSSAIRSAPYTGYRTLGENMLRGPSSMTADVMQDAWMNSPGHRANILSSAYTSVAIATGMGSDGLLYATAVFGG